MAKMVKMPRGKEFQFRPARAAGSKYDWDNWLDGQLWQLEQSLGEKNSIGAVTNVTERRDYEVPTNYMPSKLKLAGRKRYKIVQISRFDADGQRLKDSLIIKARDMNEEERQAEDLLRAEEKAELERKRAAGVKVSKNGDEDENEDEGVEDE